MIEDESNLQVSNSAMIPMSSQVIIIGGSRLTFAEKNIIAVNSSGKTNVLGQLAIPVSSHAAAYSGKSIYVFGGELTIGDMIIEGIGTSNFYKITSEFFDCSYGNYGTNCSFCEPGFFNSNFNSDTCSPCKKGTYSPKYGQSYYSQCIPCDYGSFSSVEGSKICLLCNPEVECSIGSTNSGIELVESSIVSIQPANYQSNLNEANSDNFYFAIASVVVL